VQRTRTESALCPDGHGQSADLSRVQGKPSSSILVVSKRWWANFDDLFAKASLIHYTTDRQTNSFL